MILEKAYYQQNYQVGQFLFTNYGLGAFIEEGETHQEVYAQLKERVHAQFMADNPHLQNDSPQPSEPEVLPESQIIRSGDVTKDLAYQINTSDNYDTLGKTFGPLMKLEKYADVLPIYEARREFLKQKEIAHIFEMTEAQTKTSNIIKSKKNLE